MNTHKDRIFIAIFFCIFAHFMFAVMGACAKILATNHHVAEIAFYRNLIVFLPLLICIIIRKQYHLFRTKKPKLVAARAITGAFSVLVTFAALTELPIAYATVLFFTSSIITPVLAFIFLKEKIGKHRWSAVFIGMCGVVIIAQPSGSISLWGLSFALIAACMHASMFAVLRGLKTESPIMVTFYFMLAGILIPGLFMPWVAATIHSEELWIFLLIGIAGGVGQLSLSNAYKYAPASLVTPFAYTALLWTILIDIYIWNIELEFLHLFVGAAFIMSAQLYIIYREYKIVKENR